MCLWKDGVSLSLTWPPEPVRWSQQPAAPRLTSQCASLYIFALGLWSPWRREETELDRNTVYKGSWSIWHSESAAPVWVSVTLREGDGGVCGAPSATIESGKGKKKKSAGRFSLRSVDSRQRVTRRPLNVSQVGKPASMLTPWIRRRQKANDLSGSQWGHVRNDKKPEGKWAGKSLGQSYYWLLLVKI